MQEASPPPNHRNLGPKSKNVTFSRPAPRGPFTVTFNMFVIPSSSKTKNSIRSFSADERARPGSWGSLSVLFFDPSDGTDTLTRGLAA